MRIKRVLSSGVALLLLLCVAGAGSSLAGGSISIAPTRILLDGRDRIATVYLSNNGDRAASYRVMLRDKRMLLSGQIADLAAGETLEHSALALIRYSPRRVRIPAHGSQTVRLKLQNPSGADLQRGEYRTHLVFQSIPDARSPADDGTIQPTAIIETSIPIIVRRQNPAAAARLSAAAIDTSAQVRGRPRLDVLLEREGERSLYGDVTVAWADGGRTRRDLAVIRGLAVYYPTPHRRLRIPLDLAADERLDRGDLIVEFHETPEGGGDAEARLVLPIDAEAFASR